MELRIPSLGDENDMTSAATTYMVVGSFSIAACAALAVIACLVPSARREHASKMLLIVACSDLLFTLKYWIADLLYLMGHTDSGKSFHVLNDQCALQALYGFVTATSSQLWNAAFAFEVLCLMLNPLRSTRSQFKWYNAVVWTSIAVMAAYLYAAGSYKTANPQLCMFISPAASRATIAVAELPVYASTALALGAMLFALVRLCCTRGSCAARRARLHLFSRHLIYLAIFMAVWTWDIFSEFINASSLDTVFGGSQGLLLASVRLVDLWYCGMLEEMPCCRSGRFQGAAAAQVQGAKPIAVDDELPTQASAPLLPAADEREGPAPGSAGERTRARGARARGVVPQQDSDAVSAAHFMYGRQASAAALVVQRSNSRSSINLLREPSRLSASGSVNGGAAVDDAYEFGASEHQAYRAGAAALGNQERFSAVGGDDDGNEEGAFDGAGFDAATQRGSVSTRLRTDRSRAADAATVLQAGIGTDSARSLMSSSMRYNRRNHWDVTRHMRDEFAVCLLSGLCQALLHGNTLRGLRCSAATGARPGGGLRSMRAWDADEDTWHWRCEALERINVDAYAANAEAHLRRAGSRVASTAALPAAAGSKWTTRRQSAMGIEMQVGAGASLARVPQFGELAVLDMFEDFTVTSYCESLFAEIRAAAGVSINGAVEVLDPALLLDGVLTAHFSDAGSSSFFCHAVDGSTIVKTASADEVAQLLAALPSYVQHLRANPSSLLCRFYGCYAINVTSMQRVWVVLMSNALPVAEPAPHTVVFDLKGSTTNRDSGVAAVERMLARRRQVSSAAVSAVDERVIMAQDAAFARMFPHGLAQPSAVVQLLTVGDTGALAAQLRRDVQWLASRGLMDYSLLLMVTPLNGPARGAGEAVPGSPAAGFQLSFEGRICSVDDGAALVAAAAARSLAGRGAPPDVSSMAAAVTLGPWSPLAVRLCSDPAAARPTASLQDARVAALKRSSSGASTWLPATGGAVDASTPSAPPTASMVLVQVGVIDVLQGWDLRKRSERAVKRVLHAVSCRHRGAPFDISAIEPNAYADRFLGMVARVFPPQ